MKKNNKKYNVNAFIDGIKKKDKRFRKARKEQIKRKQRLINRTSYVGY